MARRYWIETLGCPKNKVDSDKLVGTLEADGLVPAGTPEAADLVVVNTCAFIEAARQESIDTVLALSESRRPGARLVVTGCLAARYGEEVAPPLTSKVPRFDLLNLPRPRSPVPWAYVKVAEGCDRACGFCAIPSFRGKQRSRSVTSILDEVDQLGAATGTPADVVV